MTTTFSENKKANIETLTSIMYNLNRVFEGLADNEVINDTHRACSKIAAAINTYDSSNHMKAVSCYSKIINRLYKKISLKYSGTDVQDTFENFMLKSGGYEFVDGKFVLRFYSKEYDRIFEDSIVAIENKRG